MGVLIARSARGGQRVGCVQDDARQHEVGVVADDGPVGLVPVRQGRDDLRRGRAGPEVALGDVPQAVAAAHDMAHARLVRRGRSTTDDLERGLLHRPRAVGSSPPTARRRGERPTSRAAPPSPATRRRGPRWARWRATRVGSGDRGWACGVLAATTGRAGRRGSRGHARTGQDHGDAARRDDEGETLAQDGGVTRSARRATRRPSRPGSVAARWSPLSAQSHPAPAQAATAHRASRTEPGSERSSCASAVRQAAASASVAAVAVTKKPEIAPRPVVVLIVLTPASSGCRSASIIYRRQTTANNIKRHQATGWATSGRHASWPTPVRACPAGDPARGQDVAHALGPSLRRPRVAARRPGASRARQRGRRAHPRRALEGDAHRPARGIDGSPRRSAPARRAAARGCSSTWGRGGSCSRRARARPSS